jgi:peptidyl-prolyl cis-trans isomerase B (cyclophilin B)
MIRTTTNRRRLAMLAIALGLLATACGGGDTDSETSAPTTSAPSTTQPLIPLQGPPTDYEGFRAQAPACDAESPPATGGLQFATYEDDAVPVGTTATITTSCGEIVIELDPVAAPETTKSFVFLANQGYFDGTAFHRVLPGFVIQGGDPTATGRGEPGYVVPDEYPADDFEYSFGVVAMANAGPGTTGSQFFIMVGEAGLPPTFSPFGRVLSGDETLLDIVRVPLAVTTRGERSIPLETVYIESVTINTP